MTQVVEVIRAPTPVIEISSFPMVPGPPGAKGDKGDTGQAEQWHSGPSPPPGAIGSLGDWYLDTVSGIVYEKNGPTHWDEKGSLLGPQGPQGIQGEQGIEGPVGQTGPQGEQGPQGIQGPIGQAEDWSSGVGPPSPAVGQVGDFYLDGSSGVVYEKVAPTTWTSRANLSGPPGPQGAPGPPGPQGAGSLPADVINPAGTRLLADYGVAGDVQPLYRLYGSGKQEWGPGGATAIDTTLYRLSIGTLKTDGKLFSGGFMLASDGTNRVISGDVSQILAGAARPGLIFGLANDTYLFRAGAAYLKTDGSMAVGNGTGGGLLALNPAVAGLDPLSYYNGLDSQPRFILKNDGKLWFGVGGATAVDTNFYRSAAGRLATDKALVAADGTNGMIELKDDGGASIYLGPKSGGYADVWLYRSGAGRLQLHYDVIVDNDLFVNSKLWLVAGGLVDTNLYRAGAAYLKTDGSFAVGNGSAGGLLVLNPAAAGLDPLQFYNGLDNQPRVKLANDAKLWFGVGGATAVDTNLYRSAAGVLYTDGEFRAANGIGIDSFGNPATKLYLNAPRNVSLWAQTFQGEWAVNTQTPFVVGLGASWQMDFLYNASAGYGPMISFGTARDVNLYRDGANVLATDDQFWIKGAAGLKFPDGTTQITAASGGGGGFTTVTKSADDQVLGSTTLAADTHLFFATVLGAVYEFEAVIIVSSAVSSNDVRLAFGEDSTLRGAWGGPSVTSADAGGTFAQPTVNNIGSIGGTGAGVLRAYAIRGAHVAAGGTFRFLFCQNTVDATNPTIIKAGSLLRYRRIL